jgi:hypothetical protein|tara:strand:- start:411 stop:608 length:198 start_codon:yes stop_codon:yes gene_type:complete
VQNLSIQWAKVKEIEHAYLEAARNGQRDRAEFWNRELIHHLLVLSAAIRDSNATSGTDSGEREGL